MPELPEVEITRLGIAPGIARRTIERVVVRNADLRWRVPGRLGRTVAGHSVERTARRGKYLLIYTGNGAIIVHLGMSGSLRILDRNVPPSRHDHVDIVFDNGTCLRYRDPRRFGCVLWSKNPLDHPLLRRLGPEPLESGFDGRYLHQVARRRTGPVKSLLMRADLSP